MAPPESAQLRFLSDAAELMRVQSPSTAAYLLGTQTRILHEELKSLNVRQQKKHCGGCGSLRQSQWTQVTEIKPKNRRLATSKPQPLSGATVYKCLRCNQRMVHPRKRNLSKQTSKASSRTPTDTASPSPALPALSAETSAPTPQTLHAVAAPPPPVKTAENANSKKRAKARKQGGLQALLASKKSAQPSLDLFDFLQ